MADVKELTTLLELLNKERSEQAAAQDKFERVAGEELDKGLELLLQRHQDISATSQETAKVLDNMQTNLARIEQINADPMLQLIEPLAGKFNPQFSREALARKLQTDEQKLVISNRRVSLREAQRTAEANVSAARIARAQFDAKAEAQDVSALQSQMDDLRQIGQDLDQATLRALEKATPERLELVSRGKMSAEDAGFSAAQARREILLRASREQNVASNELAIQAARDARLERQMQNADLSTLDDMLDNGTITKNMHEGELIRRQSRRLAMVSLEQGIRMNDAKIIEDSRQALLRSMTQQDFDEAIVNARESGVWKFSVGGTTLSFPLGELMEHRAGAESARLQLATDEVLAETADVGITSGAKGIARATSLGSVDTSKAGTVGFIFDSVASDEQLSQEARNKAATIAALYKQAEQAKEEGAVTRSAQLRSAAAKVVNDLETTLHAQKLETTPKDMLPATKEYLASGRVHENINAITAVSTKLTTGQRSTGPTAKDRVYDTALDTIFKSDKQVAGEAVHALKFTDPMAFYGHVIGNDNVRVQAAISAMNTAISALYEKTARLLNDEQLIAMLGNPGSMIHGPDGSLSERQMFAFLHQRPTGQGGTAVSIDVFLQKLRQEAPLHFREMTTPSGDDAVIQASLNELLWDSEPVAFFVEEMNKRIKAAAIPPAPKPDLTTPEGIRRQFAPFDPRNKPPQPRTP